MQEMGIYLRAGTYTNSEHPLVRAYAQKHAGHTEDQVEQAVALYYAVRDGFKYNPYDVKLLPKYLKADNILGREHGYCVEKSNLMAAAARSLGIPTRLGFAIVRNHLATERLEKMLGTDLLVFHGYVELWLENKWVKATPVFDAELCRKLNVDTLEFDGREDSLFQESDKEGGPFMDYVHDYGHFADVPFELFVSELRKHYPSLFELSIQERPFPWIWEGDLKGKEDLV